jgi:hypothetical protein
MIWYATSYTTNKLIWHRRREWDFDNYRVVAGNKGKYKQTQQDALLDELFML